MPGELQPLVNNQRIVRDDGTPTEYFIRWAQERQIDIGEGISAAGAQQLIDDWAAGRDIIAGVGLDGGGDLSADRTIDLSDTLVVPGTYGDATHSARLVIDQQGRVQAATQVAISGGGGGGGPWYFDPPAAADFPDIIGGATVTEDTETGLHLYVHGAAAAPNVIGKAIPTPTADWSMSIHLISGMIATGYANAGLALYNAAKNKFFFLSYDSRNWIHFYRENPGGYDGYETNVSLSVIAPTWLRYRYFAASGDVHCDYSYDGKLWLEDIFVRNVSGDLGGDPAYYGLMLGSEAYPYPVTMTVDACIFTP